MADKQVSELTAATSVTGPELVHVVQGGNSRQATVTQLLAPVAGLVTQQPQANGLVTGGQVAWESGLTFWVSAATYYINGVLYSSAEQTITLSAADASNGRIDVIALDTTGTVVKITGTAAAAYSEPDYDPTTQIKLQAVTVAASGTAPAGVTIENVYLEDTEWTTTTSGSGFTKNSTNNPYAGTKCIEGTTVANGAYIKLVRSSSLDPSGYQLLRLFIRSKAAWNSGRVLRLQFYFAGVAKGVPVTLASGFWGFDSSITASYQFVGIPMSNFVIPAGTNVDELRITDSGGSIGFFIDNITLQSTASSTSTPVSYLTKAQADAFYAPKVPQIQAVTSAATVTPDFANDMVKITAQAAGLTLANPTGTAIPGWGIVIRIKDNGTARAISYGTQYRAIGVTLPTTTVISKTLYLGCIWNADDTKLDVVAVAQEA